MAANLNRRTALGLSAATAALCAAPDLVWGQTSAADPGALKLWYRAPAELWTEALPVGNGRLGAMVFGAVARERLQLNEDTLWAGGPYDPSNPDAGEALPEVRRLIFEGRYVEAQELAHQRMMARPIRQMSYQSIGDLMLTFGVSGAAESYRRELDLETAIARTSYRRERITYTREVFASAPADVLVVRLTADRPAAISLDARFETLLPGEAAIEEGDCLVLRGRNTSAHGVDGALQVETRAKVRAEGGSVAPCDEALSVRSADAVTILIASATSYVRFDDVSGDPGARTRERIAAASAQSFERLRATHVADYQALFQRVSLDLGVTPAAARPTDERIHASQTSDDPALAALYFQYARYLLISCSRPGSQPANLQGLWNDRLNPPWGSKYTININTEMNYWPAEPTNLAECVEPLVRMVNDIAVTGARTAAVNYGARGWVAHHNTDLWRATAPIDAARFGMWPMGGAWLCQHLWDHYDYGRDADFLAEIYPIMRGACEFFVDTLVEAPDGHLVTSPSMSPENLHPHGASICAGPAMDSQILRDLFDRTIRAAEILDRDADFRGALAVVRARLTPDRIGAAGQLQEWREDWDMEAPEPNHRHVSHLYALFPSEQINPRETPALAQAARRSLELRGDLSTGWAIAWRINLWARLGEAEHTHDVLKLLLGPERTYPNMFDAHPPFQIDGNFGGANGVAEMLLQCYGGEIHLLPALPAAWPRGSVRGLRARGGFVLDIAWASGTLTSATVRGAPGGEATLRYGDITRRVRAGRGRSVRLRWNGRSWR